MSSEQSSGTLRRLYAAFDRHPKLEAALEVLFNIIVGFAPFLIISFAKSEDSSQISPTFWSFFSAGELIISLFSTCAAILWLTFFKPQKIRTSISKFIVLIIVLFGILFSGVVIGENIGFKEEISKYNQDKILAMYALSLIIWFMVSISNTGSKDGDIKDPTKAIDKKYLRTES